MKDQFDSILLRDYIITEIYKLFKLKFLFDVYQIKIIVDYRITYNFKMVNKT